VVDSRQCRGNPNRVGWIVFNRRNQSSELRFAAPGSRRSLELQFVGPPSSELVRPSRACEQAALKALREAERRRDSFQATTQCILSAVCRAIENKRLASKLVVTLTATGAGSAWMMQVLPDDRIGSPCRVTRSAQMASSEGRTRFNGSPTRLRCQACFIYGDAGRSWMGRQAIRTLCRMTTPTARSEERACAAEPNALDPPWAGADSGIAPQPHDASYFGADSLEARLLQALSESQNRSDVRFASECRTDRPDKIDSFPLHLPRRIMLRPLAPSRQQRCLHGGMPPPGR